MKKALLPLLVFAALLGGCATKKVFRINTNPEGATLTVPYGAYDVKEYITPCDIPDDLSLEAELTVRKEGYPARTVRLMDLVQIADRTYLIRLEK